MPSQTGFPFRQIHLDFHTGPWIPGIGSEFTPEEFARVLKEAHVNSITVFAKCHHGHLYYDTARPERHPGLSKDVHLLEEQIAALKEAGIRAPIYISVQCDEYAANTHPEWIARNPDGSQVGPTPYQPGWQILDMSSDYQEFLADQTHEVLQKFSPTDGIFFDMCWDQPSASKWAKAGMRKMGLNPENEAERALYARHVSRSYMDRYYKMVQSASPGAGVYFNCRPVEYFPDEIENFEQVEIEALATGGWGYLFFPTHVRFLRNLDRPTMGMTARFHKSWADFGGLKPEAALEYETAQMVAHGAACSIGDQLHPRGFLDKAAYQLIGKVYGRIEEREPWLEGAKPVVQIGVIQAPRGPNKGGQNTDFGVTRLLTQLKHQFDILPQDADFSKYELLIFPDEIEFDPIFANKVSSFLANGGKALFTGKSGLNAKGTELTFSGLGVMPDGESPFSATYVRFGEKIAQGVPPTDHVIYDRGLRVRPTAGAEVLAHVVEPYFERAWDHFCSHNQTPTDKVSEFPAAVIKGPVAMIPYPVFGSYLKHANLPLRHLVGNVLNLLLPQPLIKVEGPSSTEATVTSQPGRLIVHLLQYCPERRGDGLDIVEDVVPIFNVPVALKAKAPKKVYMAPEGTDLEFSVEGDYVTVTVPEVRGHAMVVFESE